MRNISQNTGPLLLDLNRRILFKIFRKVLGVPHRSHT